MSYSQHNVFTIWEQKLTKSSTISLMPAIVKMMINGTRVVYLPVGDTSGICCKTRDQKREVDKLKSSRRKNTCIWHSPLTLLQFCYISVVPKPFASFQKLCVTYFFKCLSNIAMCRTAKGLKVWPVCHFRCPFYYLPFSVRRTQSSLPLCKGHVYSRKRWPEEGSELLPSIMTLSPLSDLAAKSHSACN